MDRSKAERRGEGPADQAETEGSRAVRVPNGSVTKRRKGFCLYAFTQNRQGKSLASWA